MRLDPLKIQVRPLSSCEEPRFNALMREHHYLGYPKVIGERIHYVATAEGADWLALLTWAAAALKIKARDEWLGWSIKQRESRLKFVANNSRFLILPEFREPNLASVVLAKNLRRLSQDWETKYGHPILMAETFVEAKKFLGTCYRASNWLQLGETAGFSKTHEKYLYHGDKKLIFVKPLSSSARHQLGGEFTHPIFLPITARGKIMTNIDTLLIFGPGGLFEYAGTLKDGRSKHGKRYRTQGMITLTILATLTGVKGFKGIFIWVGSLNQKTLEQLKLWKKPSLSTIRRFMLSLSAEELEHWITTWLLKSKSLRGKALAVDGKTLRGSHDGEKRSVQLLSIVDHEDGTIIAQREIGSKTNEIPVVQKLLPELDIRGSVVTGDALHTQDKTGEVVVVDCGAKYVFIAKDNRPTLKKEIQEQLSGCAFSPEQTITTVEKAHGRIEERTIRTLAVAPGAVSFPFASQIFSINRVFTPTNGKRPSSELVYGVTNLTPEEATPARVLEFNRGHWSIENKVHYVRDGVLAEDHSRIRKGSGPQVFASIRNLALNLLRSAGVTNISEAMQNFAYNQRALFKFAGTGCYAPG